MNRVILNRPGVIRGHDTSKDPESGETSYTTQIVRRKFGYNEAKSFDTRKKAERWVKKRETEIDQDIERGRTPISRAVKAKTLGAAINMYIKGNRREIGRTKEQVLQTIKEYDIADSGAGVWSRDANRCYRFGRNIEAGRVWVNNYHAYPAHAAFGGYKQSGIGRETHKMMLDHYQQIKNILMSYNPNKVGFF